MSVNLESSDEGSSEGSKLNVGNSDGSSLAVGCSEGSSLIVGSSDGSELGLFVGFLVRREVGLGYGVGRGVGGGLYGFGVGGIDGRTYGSLVGLTYL